MASSALQLLLSRPISSSSSSPSPSPSPSPSLSRRRRTLSRTPSPVHHFPFPSSPNHRKTRSIALSFAAAESDSTKSTDDDSTLRSLLQELADSFDLPSDYLAELPRDLRLDLNDAAFDLSNGPVVDECGQELGQILLNLSKSWEQVDTTTSCGICGRFPALGSSLTDNEKSAFGKRLVSAGRRFTSMGQYGQGELGRIANAMMKSGKFLSATPVVQTDVKPKTERRTLKFGDLQVELTPEKAFAGTGIAVVFGILAGALARGIESIPESSLQYGNDNALLLAKSLRGALLTLGYSSTILSGVAAMGLLLLGRQLSSNAKSEQ